jgi:hypothetical protein
LTKLQLQGSGFPGAPVQSQRRDKKKEDKHHPQVREKVQGEGTQLFFVHLKPLSKPWSITIPQGQGDNPVEQSEEDPNSEGTQEKVSEENDFFALHDSSVISNGGIDARLSGLRNLREFAKSMDQLRTCESAK